MFKITEDCFLEEGEYCCPKCGAKNRYYFRDWIYTTCVDCYEITHPRPGQLLTNQNYRLTYHFKGKDLQNEKTGKGKVYSCGYSPY